MGYHSIKASQLTGAQVTSSSGTEVGTISDLIINPGVGRVEFAVLSLSSSGGTGSATSPSGSSSASGTSSGSTDSKAAGGSSTTGGAGYSSSTGSAAGKQVAVPWLLVRPSTSTGSSATTSASQQPAFVFAGDVSKLEAAPSFDASTDLSQPTWRRSVFSYFGLGGGAATGGAESPGGASSSGSSSSTPDSGSGTPK
jgi:sporulation protein YlmC with PRC-barrel domain